MYFFFYSHNKYSRTRHFTSSPQSPVFSSRLDRLTLHSSRYSRDIFRGLSKPDFKTKKRLRVEALYIYEDDTRDCSETLVCDGREPKRRRTNVGGGGGGGKKRSGGGQGGTEKRGVRSTSKYRGVTHHCRTGRWEAHIWEEGKQVYLGGFDSEEQAALAYDVVGIKTKKKQKSQRKERHVHTRTLAHMI